MSQTLTYCTGGAFLSAVSAACAAVRVSAATIAAAETSRTFINPAPPFGSSPEIVILHLPLLLRGSWIRSWLPYPSIPVSQDCNGRVLFRGGLRFYFLQLCIRL